MEGQIPEELQGQEEREPRCRLPAQGRVRAKREREASVACGGLECASLQFHIAPREL